MNGKEVNTTLTFNDQMSGSVGAAKEQIDSIPESKTTSLGTTIMNAIGGLLGALSLSAYKEQIEAIPDNKTTTLNVNAEGLSDSANVISNLNAEVEQMQDKSVTASTFTPNMPSNTDNVKEWNTAVDASKSKSTTATSNTPNIKSNTDKVWSWISALGSTYNKSSTLTTYVDKVYRTIGKHAEGGHIDQFAKGGHVKWGGLFASGGNVPMDYAGIVGEAGPELFQVTRSGVKITPLSSQEKMRGIKGVLDDMHGIKNTNSNETINVSVNINYPTLTNNTDLNQIKQDITQTINEALGKVAKRQRRGLPG